WAGLGVGVVIFSAALSSIPAELFEAAEIDGASWWQRLRYVMLPGMRSTVELYVVFQVLSVFLFLFGWIYVVTQGGPGYSSTTLDYDIYQNALSYGIFGLAAAESVYLLAIVLLILGVGAWLQRRRDGTLSVDPMNERPRAIVLRLPAAALERGSRLLRSHAP